MHTISPPALGGRFTRPVRAAVAVLLALAGLAASGPAQAAPAGCTAWMDRHLPADRRAGLVLAQMTLDEKVGMLHAISDGAHDREVPPVPRLCVPALLLNNGPAGVGSSGPVQAQATAMPAPLGLAASFDPSMARAYGVIEGRETRDTGRNLMEGPDINIARRPARTRTSCKGC